MLVKWTKSIPGGDKRGFVEGREFDWPMQIISKLRADYGQDCLVMVGVLADRNARQKARQEAKAGGPKPSRQERLGVADDRTGYAAEEMAVPKRRGRPPKVQSEEVDSPAVEEELVVAG